MTIDFFDGQTVVRVLFSEGGASFVPFHRDHAMPGDHDLFMRTMGGTLTALTLPC